MHSETAPPRPPPKPVLSRQPTANAVQRQYYDRPPVPARHSKTLSYFSTHQFTPQYAQQRRSQSVQSFSHTQPIDGVHSSHQAEHTDNTTNSWRSINNKTYDDSLSSYKNNQHTHSNTQYDNVAHNSNTQPANTYYNTELLKTYTNSITQRNIPFISYNEDYNHLYYTEKQAHTGDIGQYNAAQHITLLIELAAYVRQVALNDEDCVSCTAELAIRIQELIAVLNEHKQTLTTYICDNTETTAAIRNVIQQIRQSLTGGRVILNNALETYRVVRSMQYKQQLRILLNDVIAHTSKLLHTISITLLKHNKLDTAKPVLKLRPGQDACLQGDKHFYGHTVPVNYIQAYQCYETAAKLLYSPAMYNIACMLLNGKQYDIVPDTAKAIHYLKQAVQLNNVDAMNMLAQQYETGNGVARNLELAVELYHTAADRGHVDAICNLAYIYEHGSTDDASYIAVDLDAAVAWYIQAADKHNSSKAQNNLAALYYSGKLSADGVPDYSTAFHWFTLAAQQGNVSAQCNLATMYERGAGCIRDVEQAVVYYTLAAKQQHVQAATSLGYLLFKQQQYAAAYNWLRKASEHEDSTAMFYIAQMYSVGCYVEQSSVVAYQYFHAAALLNNVLAVYELANCLYNGVGCVADQPYALELYNRCANSGNAQAMHFIAQCYHNGTVYEQSIADAIEWYALAAQHGHGDSAYALSELYSDSNTAEYNVELAQDYLQQAVQLGSTLARAALDSNAAKSAFKRTTGIVPAHTVHNAIVA